MNRYLVAFTFEDDFEPGGYAEVYAVDTLDAIRVFRLMFGGRPRIVYLFEPEQVKI